jgi:DNA-binding protein HU-beta
MRKADLVAKIADKTGIAKVDVLVTLEEFFTEVKNSLADGENVYVRGFGSFKKELRKSVVTLKTMRQSKFPLTIFPLSNHQNRLLMR